MSLFDWSKKAKPSSLEPEQFQSILSEVGKDDLVLVDVREEYEFKKSHFQGAVNIPTWELERRWKELDKDKRIALYCASGHRSARAAKILTNVGFTHLYLLRGGLAAWYMYVQSKERPRSP